MNKCNSAETIDKTNLTNQKKFQLDEIINIQIILSKRLIKENHAGKYVTVCDYIDQALIVLSAASRGVSIISLRVLLEHQLE